MEYVANDSGQTLNTFCPIPWDIWPHPMGQVVPPPGTNIKWHEKMKRLVVRQKELHTLANCMHTLIKIPVFQIDNLSVYVVYAEIKQIFICKCCSRSSLFANS